MSGRPGLEHSCRRFATLRLATQKGTGVVFENPMPATWLA
ncbi:hypothetical protein RISK_006018 [Rhodopirellula islandica]|uniref:Uncharacterized protein n=1 Tax=Rhodopirellula islandica TaxID=595434 RepID=A0A0J1E8P3_RHOIS|nr:hypothetical protein RISK_006018 [Rhodopirellula islandica]